MVNVVVEGDSDRGVALRLLQDASLSAERLIVTRGKARLDEKLLSYNKAAARDAWFVLRDSDRDCPVRLIEELLPDGAAPGMRFRLAQSMSESWLMADHEAFSTNFFVSRDRLPAAPDELDHAKRTMLALCTRSRSRQVREGMVTREGRPGPLYVDLVNEFAETSWSPERAALRSPSLRRAIAALATLTR